MISEVTERGSTYLDPPHRFEAGTPNISGAIGLGTAIDFVQQIGLSTVFEQEQKLTQYADQELAKIDGLTIYGRADEKINITSFNIEGIHASDVATILNQESIAVALGSPLLPTIDEEIWSFGNGSGLLLSLQ